MRSAIDRTMWMVTAMMVALTLATTTASAEDPPAFRFGEYVTTIAPLQEPTAVAIDTDGTVYIVEAGADRVSVYSPSGELLRTIGESGTGTGQLLMPHGVALTDDAVYVSDTGNHRVQVYDRQGKFIRGFGSRGNRPWQLKEPRAIAADFEKIYVADLGNRRVQVFDHAGAAAYTIGGSGKGGLRRPVGIAIDPGGNMYVSDTDLNGVARFGSDGFPLEQWGDWGPFLGLMDEPRGIAYFGKHVYVADTRNHRIQTYERDGTHVEQWGTHAVAPHEGEGKLHYPNALAIAGDASIAVVCEGFENRCQIFRRDPSSIADAGMPIVPVRKMKAHFGERLTIDGKLLAVAEPENHRIYVFELSRDIPIVIGDFGDRGPRPGQMIRLSGLALDVNNEWLHATDVATRRLQSFRLDYDPEGPRGYAPRRARFAQAWDLEWLRREIGVRLAWEIDPAAIRCDADGNVYIVDSSNAVVIGLEDGMTRVNIFGGYGDLDGMFRRPTDLAFSRDGRTIFVVDSNNHRVQAFDRNGKYLRTIGAFGNDPGTFRRPFGITAGRDEFVYVTDEVRNRVLKFKETGAFVQEWGRFGVEQGELWRPKGIAQDERLRLYVVDFGNHRAQAYSSDGEWLVSFGTGCAYTKWDRGQQETKP